jgi:WD40 repeat protein
MKKDAVRSTAIAEATSPRVHLKQYCRLLMIFVVMALVLPMIPIPVWSMGRRSWENSSLRFSPDGRLIAVAFARKVYPIRLIDFETGKIIRTIPKESAVGDLSFSPNGDLLAAIIRLSSEPQRGVVRVWNIHTGEEIGHNADAPAVFYISFLEDNRTVAYDSSVEDLELWNIEDGATKKTGQRLLDVTHSADFPRMSGAGFQEKGIHVTAHRKEAAPVVVKIAETDEIVIQPPVDGTVQSLFFDHSGETLAVLVQKEKAWRRNGFLKRWATS